MQMRSGETDLPSPSTADDAGDDHDDDGKPVILLGDMECDLSNLCYEQKEKKNGKRGSRNSWRDSNCIMNKSSPAVLHHDQNDLHWYPDTSTVIDSCSAIIPEDLSVDEIFRQAATARQQRRHSYPGQGPNQVNSAATYSIGDDDGNDSDSEVDELLPTSAVARRYLDQEYNVQQQQQQLQQQNERFSVSFPECSFLNQKPPTSSHQQNHHSFTETTVSESSSYTFLDHRAFIDNASSYAAAATGIPSNSSGPASTMCGSSSALTSNSNSGCCYYAGDNGRQQERFDNTISLAAEERRHPTSSLQEYPYCAHNYQHYHQQPPPTSSLEDSFSLLELIDDGRSNAATVATGIPSSPSSSTPKDKVRVEVAPGIFLPLRGSAETIEAIETGYTRTVTCLSCSIQLLCVADCEMVVCPECRFVSPVPISPDGDDEDGGEDDGDVDLEGRKRGVGLGVKI